MALGWSLPHRPKANILTCALQVGPVRWLLLATVSVLLFSSCFQAKTEEEMMLQTEINNGQPTPPPAPAPGDQLPPGHWTVDNIALGEGLEDLKRRLGEPHEMGAPPVKMFPNHTAQVEFDAQGKVVKVRGSSVYRDGERVVDSGNMLEAIPWRMGVEGKLEKSSTAGRYAWSRRVEKGQTLIFRTPEGARIIFQHSNESGSTELTLEP